jgi:hypothetical protein
LQWQLVTWLNSGTGADAPNLDAEALLQVADDPARKQQVQEAFAKAAETLGLPSRETVIQLVEELAQELAYIEALRDRLLRRVKAMADKLNRMAQSYRGDGAHLETLTQVTRLRGFGRFGDDQPFPINGLAAKVFTTGADWGGSEQ